MREDAEGSAERPHGSEQSRDPDTVNNEIGSVFGSAVQAGSINFNFYGSVRRLPTPRQVPSLESPFVNRRTEVRELDTLLEREHVGVTPVAVISGMRGVGKTSIGRYWAHLNGDRFDGGQLHADFNELRRGGGADVTELLGSFLRALGFADEVIPATLAERSALFASSAAEKNVLLLLDNVDHVAQVTPLIPAPSGSVVLVTSRWPLAELSARGAAPIELAPLDEEDAAELLAFGEVNAARLEAEPEAAEALIEVCGGLPIALKVCGSLLARESHQPVSWLAEHLSDESARLRRMGLSSEESVEAVFTAAYTESRAAIRKLYRILGTHPGPSFTPHLAAAAAQVSLEEARQMLGELQHAQLIEGTGERFRFHELLRIHARGRAAAEEPEAEQEAIMRRIVDYYVAATQRMDFAIIPVRLRLSDPPCAEPAAALPGFGSTAEALDWFDEERANILAVLRAATARDWNASAWRIGEALWLPYHNRKYCGEAIEVYTLAAVAAHGEGDIAAEARLRSQLARAYLDLEDHAGAEAELKLALGLAERSNHRELRASVVEFTGVLAAARGDYPEAIVAFERARAVCEELGSERGIAIQEYHLGRVLGLNGEPERAIACLQHAIDLIDPQSDGLTLGRALIHLGEAQRACGDPQTADITLRSAIDAMHAVRAPFYEAQARECLARVKRDLGDLAAVRQQLQQALEVYDELKSPRADEVRSVLADASAG